MRMTLNVIALLAVIAALSLGIRSTYQAGWHAHQIAANEEAASLLAKNKDAAQRASKALTETVKQLRLETETLTELLKKADAYETSADSDACGIPTDGLRLLEAIR